MGLKKLEKLLEDSLKHLEEEGRLKGKEFIITDIKKTDDVMGPRYYLKGKGEKPFIRMNSNSYLGLSLRDDIISAGKGLHVNMVQDQEQFALLAVLSIYIDNWSKGWLNFI